MAAGLAARRDGMAAPESGRPPAATDQGREGEQLLPRHPCCLLLVPLACAAISNHSHSANAAACITTEPSLSAAMFGVIEPALQAAEFQRAVNRPRNDPSACDCYLRSFRATRAWEKKGLWL